MRTIKEIRRSTGLSQAKFANYFNIPLYTLQDWEHERRTPPDYVVDMIERILCLEEERFKIYVEKCGRSKRLSGDGEALQNE